MPNYTTLLTLTPSQYTLFDDHFETLQPIPPSILQLLNSPQQQIEFHIDDQNNLHITTQLNS